MANHCRTYCIVTGPDAEIERFKQTCLITPPRKLSIYDHDECPSDGIDFTRAEWEAEMAVYWSTYCFHEGQHHVWIKSRWSPPVASLAKISALFPKLTFEVNIADEFYNFAYKGSIKTGVADLHDDEEAMNSYYETMQQACTEADQRHEAWRASPEGIAWAAKQAANPKAHDVDLLPL